MANQKHLKILKQGVKVWNELRGKAVLGPYSDKPWHQIGGMNFLGTDLSEADLSRADLSGADLREADLSGVDLSRADLSGVDLREADLSEANLIGANFFKAWLQEADLRQANLSGANLVRSNLTGACLVKANLSGANLMEANLLISKLAGANLVETNLERANLTRCTIYGTSVWNARLGETTQKDLVITPPDEPEITVDNLEVAQFIYLLLNNENVRKVIDTITSKVVLILGRFTPVRKKILDAIKEELRHRNYSPVLFDFDKPASRDLTETISTLAHMARFVIADLTDAKSLPQELQRIVPDLPSLPIASLLHTEAKEYAMFEHFKRYPWVLETFCYDTPDHLIKVLGEKVIGPAEAKFNELSNN